MLARLHVLNRNLNRFAGAISMSAGAPIKNFHLVCLWLITHIRLWQVFNGFLLLPPLKFLLQIGDSSELHHASMRFMGVSSSGPQLMTVERLGLTLGIAVVGFGFLHHHVRNERFVVDGGLLVDSGVVHVD